MIKLKVKPILIIASFIILCMNFGIAQNNDKIFQYYEVDKIPQFKGGKDSIETIIYTNLEWPDGETFVYGDVILSFLITEIGEISLIKVEKSLCAKCDRNAIKALKKLVSWIPGEVDKTKVKTRMFIPIRFELKPSD